VDIDQFEPRQRLQLLVDAGWISEAGVEEIDFWHDMRSNERKPLRILGVGPAGDFARTKDYLRRGMRADPLVHLTRW